MLGLKRLHSNCGHHTERLPGAAPPVRPFAPLPRAQTTRRPVRRPARTAHARNPPPHRPPDGRGVRHGDHRQRTRHPASSTSPPSSPCITPLHHAPEADAKPRRCRTRPRSPPDNREEQCLQNDTTSRQIHRPGHYRSAQHDAGDGTSRPERRPPPAHRKATYKQTHRQGPGRQRSPAKPPYFRPHRAAYRPRLSNTTMSRSRAAESIHNFRSPRAHAGTRQSPHRTDRS